jgi:hypothetical protein
VRIPAEGDFGQLEFEPGPYLFPPSSGTLHSIGEVKSYNLDACSGELLAKQRVILAYDESIKRYSALEGTAYLFAHSLVQCGKEDYNPIVFLAFYFYTRSNTLVSHCIKYSDNPDVDCKKDYVQDRTKLLSQHVPPDSILLVDGPLIGGQMSSYTVKLNEILLQRSCIPVFVVKNTQSNLVTTHIYELTGKYNSDLHWAFDTLLAGQRTNFFEYADPKNPENAKIFCYLKGFHTQSPIRVEVHRNTYRVFGQSTIENVLNLIYYLMLANEGSRDCQPRPIAIAEKFARETIKLVNIKDWMRAVGATSTVNQSRFGG